MKTKRSLFKTIAKIGAVVLGIAAATSAFAVPSLYLSTIESNLGTTVKSLASILEIISLIAGIGFVMASFFKFHQHKQNPTQVPVSQGVTLLLIGAGLMIFPLLLPTATKAAFGVTAGGMSKTTGSAINSIIGS